ncbi:hypothetical protein [Kitasatospora sp. NPDC101183]|uniref:hypothetical protein n=1 Tax=Kitasatospora sp. NPDC101183 TaxID=3364100 RepID=UPI0037F207B9
MTERRPSRPSRLPRRRRLAAGAAVVVLAGGAWWWRSAHAPAELPSAACWSLLTRADLSPLAHDATGTFVEQDTTFGPGFSDALQPRLRPVAGDQDCEVRRDAGGTLVRVLVREMDEPTATGHYGSGAKASSRLDLGADVQGWVGASEVGLAIRCDTPEGAGRGRPYVGIEVGRGLNPSPATDGTHRAVLDIALKAAKGVVRDYPCSNGLRLPDSVPESAGNFPALDH